MARHGENIRKRKDGRWEARCLYYSEEKGKNTYKYVYGRDYQEAKKKKLTTEKILREKPGEKEAGNRSRPALEDICFTDMAEQWLAQVRLQRKPSTYEKYAQVYQNHIKSRFRGVPLSGMDGESVRERLFRPGGGKGGESVVYSESMLKSIYSILNQVLKYASGRSCVPLPPLRRPEAAKRNQPARTFTAGEQGRLFDALREHMDKFKLAVLLCLYTGLRLGELCALRWEDIDFRQGVLSVRRTVQRLHVEGRRTRTALVVTAPKTGHSRREIPLPPDLLELLAGFRDGREYLFGGDSPADPRTMQNHWKKILDEAGVAYRNFHTLRHTFATDCVEGGVDVKSLSELLGHSDVNVTLNRYVHSTMDMKRRHMASLCLYYGRVCEAAYAPAGDLIHGQVCGAPASPYADCIHGQVRGRAAAGGY